jgi:glucose-6-phosphate isomerase
VSGTDRPARWRLNYGNLMAPQLEGFGLEAGAFDTLLAERFATARTAVDSWRAADRLGFIDLPTSTAAKESSRVAAATPTGTRDVVVLGIGGSALGTRTVRDALAGVRWNEESSERRGGRPRLHVIDNPDPDLYRATIGGLDPQHTVVNVISKSGGTMETLALYQAVRSWMERALGEDATRARLVFTTDPARGPLRAIAAREGIVTLEVPPNVGGRFSVLSPVGLFPAAMLGLDPAALLEGARGMEAACALETLAENPAGLIATALHSLDVDHGCSVHVLMPYQTKLGTFALWFQQLWAESLGKIRPDGSHVGPTPLSAIGASDQHAQVQLFMEGRRDKVVLFIAVPPGPDETIPNRHPEDDAMALLGGRGLGELLNIEREATAEALRQAGRPNATLELGHVDAVHLGALFHLFQRATVFAGALYGVDPLDQPGVELGKRLTRAGLAKTASGKELAAEVPTQWTLDSGV